MRSLFEQFNTPAVASLSNTQENTGFNPSIVKGNIPVGSSQITAQAATVPFWDVPPVSIDPRTAGFSPWDTVSISGQIFPGMARVRAKRSKRYDVKMSKGPSGAAFTFVGWKPADVEISISIWTQSQLNTLQSLLPIVLTKPGTLQSQDGLDVYHPSLSLIGIRSVIVFDVEPLEPGSPTGTLDYETEMPGIPSNFKDR